MNDSKGADGPSHLVIGDKAPNFTARTTDGQKSLHDYFGRWLVLFSHPADFTPVCTSEVIAFARAHDRFLAIGCDLIGLSVDSLFSHLAWKTTIEQSFSVKINYPLIEDPSMVLARAYGMLPNGANSSATVRTTFIIDPEGIVRATTCYPTNVGRNVEEVLRLVMALQTSERCDVLMPEAWQPGVPAIIAPPLTADEVEKRTRENQQPWFYRTKVVDS